MLQSCHHRAPGFALWDSQSKGLPSLKIARVNNGLSLQATASVEKLTRFTNLDSPATGLLCEDIRMCNESSLFLQQFLQT